MFGFALGSNPAADWNRSHCTVMGPLSITTRERIRFRDWSRTRRDRPNDRPNADRSRSSYPAFNDAIAGFSSLSTDESSVTVVDMATGFSRDYLRDSFNPNDAGDEFLAGRWMAALQEAGAIGTTG